VKLLSMHIIKSSSVQNV